MNAPQQLQALVAEDEQLSAEIEIINAKNERLRARRTALEQAVADAAAAVDAAKGALGAAVQAFPGPEADAATDEARSELQAARTAQGKLLAQGVAAEIDALDAAIAANQARGSKVAEALMDMSKRRSEIGAARLREYGLELAAEYQEAAQRLASVLAKGHALNRIAIAADLPMAFAPIGRPNTVVLEGVGNGQRVVVDYSSEIADYRAAYVQRLTAEGHNVLGVS